MCYGCKEISFAQSDYDACCIVINSFSFNSSHCSFYYTSHEIIPNVQLNESKIRKIGEASFFLHLCK